MFQLHRNLSQDKIIYLDLAGAERIASTAADLEANAARAALPGPTSPVFYALGLHKNKQKFNPSVNKVHTCQPHLNHSVFHSGFHDLPLVFDKRDK